MTIAIWITLVLTIVLIIADMLYGKHMCKRMTENASIVESIIKLEDLDSKLNMDYAELAERDEVLEQRLCAVELKVNKPKRTSKKKTSTKK